MSRPRKLTDDQVEYVRRAMAAYRSATKLPGPSQLARELGVATSTIWNIEHGFGYKLPAGESR